MLPMRETSQLGTPQCTCSTPGDPHQHQRCHIQHWSAAFTPDLVPYPGQSGDVLGPAQDQYLELSAALTPGSHVYGLGEQTHRCVPQAPSLITSHPAATQAFGP